LVEPCFFLTLEREIGLFCYRIIRSVSRYGVKWFPPFLLPGEEGGGRREALDYVPRYGAYNADGDPKAWRGR